MKQSNGKWLKLMIYSKKFADYLIKDLKLNYKNKTKEGKIPNEFIDWKKSRHIIRGLFETDGSLYLSKTTRHRRGGMLLEYQTASGF